MRSKKDMAEIIKIRHQQNFFQQPESGNLKWLLKILFLDHENQFIVIEIDPKSLDIKKTTFFPKGILSPTANVVFFDNDNVSSISENGEIFKTSF